MLTEHDVADHTRPPAAPPDVTQRSTGQLVMDAAGEVQTLVRKELELARHELRDAVATRAQAVGALAVGGVLVLFALACAVVAAALGLSNVMPAEAAWALMAGVFALLAAAALLVARTRARAVPLQPEKTRRSIEENARWARTQLQR